MIDADLTFFLNTYGVALMYVVTLVYLWFIEKSREEVVHVLFSGLIVGVVVLVLKEMFDIPRPFLLNGQEVLAGEAIRASFPSMHAALAFSLATTVYLHQKRFGSLLLILAIFIALGRVLANVHFPVDILIGAGIGVFVALVLEKTHYKAF